MALALLVLALPASAIQPPSGLVSRLGDQTVVLHWDKNIDADLAGYRVYRAAASTGPFSLQTPSLLTTPGYCDVVVVNGQTNFYQVTAVTTGAQESVPSVTLGLAPHPFASDDEFIEYLQQTSFDYFWYGANPANGMIPDRLPTSSPASIAAVGFGLTAIGIGIDHGWITRTQGTARVLATLNTFASLPQGTNVSGVTGYKGWYYHFIDMNTGLRYAPWSPELSSIDTALLLGGVLYAKQYFNGTNTDETSIRALADKVYSRIDWNWMALGTDALSMGWFPPTTNFLSATWIGYNEGMLLYILGLGAAANPLPASAWSRWTNGYGWATYYGQSFVPFPPLFGHQYSHCWVDFRHVADGYMNSHNSTYFLNSRRATLAQRAYCIANPGQELGYSSNVWGLTACDGPNLTINGVTYQGYTARGAPPAQNDDGTIAPTAAAGSIAFTPEYSVPTLRYLYTHYRRSIWSAYGFRDAFNLAAQWWGPDEIGIDQGPIVIMIENYRTQRVWKLFMQNQEIQRGLQRAGFVPLSFVVPRLDFQLAQNSATVSWDAISGRTYQVEYSPDLQAWFGSPTGEVLASTVSTNWTDNGPPATPSLPLAANQRFYRVFQYGPP